MPISQDYLKELAKYIKLSYRGDCRKLGTEDVDIDVSEFARQEEESEKISVEEFDSITDGLNILLTLKQNVNKLSYAVYPSLKTPETAWAYNDKLDRHYIWY
jgi:hypothetical protein